MGASTFHDFVRRDSAPAGAKVAFSRAVEQAQWECGHGGYSGTIAEKHDYKMIATVETLDEANKMASRLIDAGDPRIDDKWGPAGCIEVKGENGGWLFFGWASS